MLVDNRTNPSTPSPNLSELEEYLNTELFGVSPSPLASPLSPLSSSATMSPLSPPALAGGSGSGSDSTSSRASSPSDSLSQILSTPPQQQLENAFPVSESDPYSFLSGGGFGGFGLGFGSSASTAPSFFNFLDEENQNQNQMKVDASSSSSGLTIDADGFDFMSAFGGLAAGFGSSSSMAIDPQLVDSQETQTQRLPLVEEEKAESNKAEEESDESLTIIPVKVGGHGKARKGTVQSGGITKKVASAAPTTVPPVPTSFTATPASASRNKENLSTSAPVAYTSASSPSVDGGKDDDDDLPADWRPPPEVFAKMSSKEKRQLRNKISARNFRVRRKEYISTLEMDIAERDRLLQAIRSELGSTQSENLALRQEVAALKKALLEGRSTSPADVSPALNIRGTDINLNAAALGLGASVSLDDLNLPPPAPLPEKSAAEELALRAAAATTNATASTSGSSLIKPNTFKDIPNSSRHHNGNSFWGGVPMGGGFTPVHTVLMPDLNTNLTAANGVNMTIGQWVRDVLAANAANAEMDVDEEDRSPRALQENMNPVMNTNPADMSSHAQAGFDGFADMNPFTMKTLDAYRMQLWAKMAASSSHQQPPTPPFQQQSPSSNSSSPTSSTSSSTYLQQRKALERELSSSSPFTLPGPHQKPAKSSKPQGLASSLKPAYFVNSNKPNLPTASTSSQLPRMGNTLSALLAGKHSGAGVFGSYARGSQNANTSPFQSSSSFSPKQHQQQHFSSSTNQQQQQQQMQAMYAAALATTASQTLLGKLGSAFWDAFSGHPSSSTSTSTHPSSGAALHSGASTSTASGSGTLRPWDADKVRRVLEGKAVVRIVDVDETVVKREAPTSPTLTTSSVGPTIKRETSPAPPVMTTGGACAASECMTALLEESMKSLTLGKRSK